MSDDAGTSSDGPRTDDATESLDVAADGDASVVEMDSFVAVLYGAPPCPNGEVVVDNDAALNPVRCVLCPPCGKPPGAPEDDGDGD
jgi:hypothetical protein